MGEENTCQVFDYESAMERCCDDAEFVVEMIEQFQARAASDLDEIEQACTAGDAESMTALAHRVKGAVATLGGMAARECAAQLEEMGRSGDLTRAPEMVQSLRTEIERFLQKSMEVLSQDLVGTESGGPGNADSGR